MISVLCFGHIINLKFNPSIKLEWATNYLDTEPTSVLMQRVFVILINQVRVILNNIFISI